ncbi:DUF3040 domain-containing protein [Streptomyces sp. Da 82-17]|uniref:DUF3040 domain-containing protein n=1 Tax=Streptomyces sp. Da 82-17 TaxID=3377116 RepID=UPI0038D4E420
MTRYDDERLGDIAARLARDDPEFARAIGSGRPCRPREYRHGRAWLALTLALACLGVGIAVGHGVVIGAGLILAGASAPHFDPHRRRPPGPPPTADD